MAGEINWKLGINGLRETIAQLQVLNKELALAKNNANSIGNLNIGGNVNPKFILGNAYENERKCS